MTLFTAYRQAEHPSLRLYAPYWLPIQAMMKWQSTYDGAGWQRE